MKIVTYPHDMAVGGSQLNAIELAAALQRRGHDVIVFGQSGPLVDKVAELGLEFVQSPPVHRRPTPGVIHGLRLLVKERGIDIVHAYEWPPSLEAAIACRGRATAVAVSTVLSMSVAPFIPANMPLLVGTEQIAAVERSFGRTRVGLLEPPVDTVLNSPGLNLHVDKFRRCWGLDPEIFTVTVVSRLAHEMKLEGILSAIGAVKELNREFPVQLLITGTGSAAEEIREQMILANHALGYQRIVMTGELPDPRPAYAAADVALGMGGSALRAMAFGKPLVVQGENGYWRILTPDTLSEFLWQGWYGSGPGRFDAVSRLAGHLRNLRNDPALLRRYGEFSREIVCRRFSLDSAAEKLSGFYSSANTIQDGAADRIVRMAEASWRFGVYNVERQAQKRRGRLALDDFNASPVAAAGHLTTPTNRKGA